MLRGKYRKGPDRLGLILQICKLTDIRYIPKQLKFRKYQLKELVMYVIEVKRLNKDLQESIKSIGKDLVKKEGSSK